MSCPGLGVILAAVRRRCHRTSRHSRLSRRTVQCPSCERKWSGDSGYSVVETAIAWPVFIAVILLVVQFALLWHGRHVAEAAARDGLEAGRGIDATAATGRDAATGYLRDVAPRLLTDPRVDVTRTATTVRVQVRAHILRVLPGWDLTVSETASGPVETFTAFPPFRPSGRERTTAARRL